jgi:penicillin-binding protein-related factor A (putative recombinase)
VLVRALAHSFRRVPDLLLRTTAQREIVKAKNDGHSFERMVSQTAEAYDRKNILRLEKVEPPTRRIKIGKVWQIVELSNPLLDFAGVWTERGGRALFIEAKSTTGNESLRLEQDGGVTVKQVSALRRWHNAGAAVGVLWELDRRACAMLSHDKLVEVLATGKKSVRFEELPRVAMGMGFVIYDFAVLLRQFYP